MPFEYNNEAKFIPEWIIEKNLDQNQIYAIRSESDGGSLLRETEKAVLVVWFTEYGKVELWCPKSVLKSYDEIKAEADAEADRMANKMEAYDNLLNIAKDLKCGVRSHMKVDTIANKVREAGKFEAIADLVKMNNKGRYVLA